MTSSCWFTTILQYLQIMDILQSWTKKIELIYKNHKKSFYAQKTWKEENKSNWLARTLLLPTLWWRHNEHDGISNHQPYNCSLNHLFRRRSKKTSKLCITGLCEGNSPVMCEFPAQRAINLENVSIWWHHHETGAELGGLYLGLRQRYIRDINPPVAPFTNMI